MKLLKKLKNIPRGQILLANIYAAVSMGHVKIDLINNLLKTCSDEFNEVPENFDGPEKIYDLIIVQIRKNFSQYSFKRLPEPKGDLNYKYFAVVLDLNKFVYTAETKIMDDAKLRDLGIRREEIENDPEIADIVAEYFTNSKFLIGNAALGKAYNIFWGTATGKVEKFAYNADRVRDYLGLIDYGKNRHLFLITCSSFLNKFIKDPAVSVAAPTFFEAQDNIRFKEQSDATCEDNWGRTVDLNKVCQLNEKLVDGAPEIVFSEIRINNNFSCRYIGQTRFNPPGSDEQFAKHLAHEKSWNEIVDELENKLFN